MKKIILILSGVILICFGMMTTSKNQEKSAGDYRITGVVGTSLDYSKDENWMRLDRHPQHKVDLIYFYPTVAMTVGQNGGVLSDNTEEVKKTAQSAYTITASAFETYTNVFAPYYRQIPMETAMKIPTIPEYETIAQTTELRTDVYAALDTYFNQYNNGRPFILAGHSQGSAIIKMILGDYMLAHPDYLKRMVAAYAVGFPISQEWLRQNPQVKFAEGEDDVGVLISWNTEGPNPTKKSYIQQDGAVVINPLNWKRDETPASVLENKGSLTSHNPQEVGPGIADATLNLKRGTVVCTTSTDYIPAEMHHFFGDQSFHAHDYDFYYANIKENGQKRIDAYFQKNKLKAN